MVKNGKNVKNGNKMYSKAKRKNDAILGSAKAGFCEFLIVSIFKVLSVWFLECRERKGRKKDTLKSWNFACWFSQKGDTGIRE